MTDPKVLGANINVDNVNEALPIGLRLLNTHGVKSESRGIETIKMRGPVTTTYRHPTRRVLFDHIRDANPFFHLIEFLWILAGSNRIDLLTKFLPRYADFSDDGQHAHGAYGYRLRHAFGFDQLLQAVGVLRARPDTRQCVLSMWHPVLDLGVATKDVPCNDMIMFEIEERRLNMTVCNRSNDVIWGAYGANVVHFSMLQEWVAVMVGCEVGWYAQQSNNYHVYPTNPFWQEFLKGNYEHGDVSNPYMYDVQPWPIVLTSGEAARLMSDAEALVEAANNGDGLTQPLYKTAFMTEVVVPMILAHNLYSRRLYDDALRLLMQVPAADWRAAAVAWVQRRQERNKR